MELKLVALVFTVGMLTALLLAHAIQERVPNALISRIQRVAERRRHRRSFRRHFGTPVPENDYQRQEIQPFVMKWVRTLAESLAELYVIESDTVRPARAKTAFGARFWLETHRDLQQLIKQAKGDFYAAHDAAKAFGFQVLEDFRDYLDQPAIGVEPAFSGHE